MLFNSARYGLFLPAVLAGFFLLPQRARTWWLLAASYVFYGAWDYRFLGLIVISTVVDFWVGIALESRSGQARKRLLAISVCTNLCILGFFKYWDFFVGSAESLTRQIGLPVSLPVLQVVLPVGISFYTFQTMSYTIDVYRGKLPAEKSLPTFGLFVAFFPQLVAGPIERATSLLPQLRQLSTRWRSVDVRGAITLISVGLFKKIAIADAVAPSVNEVFSNTGAHSWLALMVAAVGFGLQIYGDFSGYSDIARGSARLFGVSLMENFAQPYLASSVTEFWRRWHISLSTWLRDYLYIPLGGNRSGRLRTYRNLMLTMLLGGLWHGAAWTFVLWGGLHGLYLATERLLGIAQRSGSRGRIGVAFTFGLVVLAWIPFRADSFGAVTEILGRMFTFESGRTDWWGLATVAVAAAFCYFIDTRQAAVGDNPVGHLRAIPRGMVYAASALAVLVFSSSIAFPFIYFQF